MSRARHAPPGPLGHGRATVAARRAPLLVALLLAAACSSAAGGANPAGGAGDAIPDRDLTTVDGVSLAVPDGWRAADVEQSPAVVGAHRWSAGPNDIGHVQVIVGCGGTVDELVEGTLRNPRGPLAVSSAEEDEDAAAVPGLDEARRLTLLFGTGRDDDAETIRTQGLYGQHGGALVLVEVTQQARTASASLADRVLDSVRVDAAALASACADAT